MFVKVLFGAVCTTMQLSHTLMILTEQARLDKARVLVHCMSGQSRYEALLHLGLVFSLWPNLFRRIWVNMTLGYGYVSGFGVCTNWRNTVHRSPAVVIAYLMKHKQWRLPQSYQWVKDRRPSINLTQGMTLQHISFSDSLCFGCGSEWSSWRL